MKAIINLTKFIILEAQTDFDIAQDDMVRGILYFDIIKASRVQRDAYVTLHQSLNHRSQSNHLKVSEPFNYQGHFNHIEFSNKVEKYCRNKIERTFSKKSSHSIIESDQKMPISLSFTIDIPDKENTVKS